MEDIAQEAHCIPISLRMTSESAWLMAGRMILEVMRTLTSQGLEIQQRAADPTNCSQTPSGGLHKPLRKPDHQGVDSRIKNYNAAAHGTESTVTEN